MSAAKVFFSYSHERLNDDLRAWLQQSDVTILDVSMDSNDMGHCLVVLYEPGGGARYDARVFHDYRHDGLESQVNRALVEARKASSEFIALGSNGQGHCLCVIRQA